MSDQGEGAGGPAPIPAPVPDSLPRLSIRVPSPKKFTGEGEDLKPEAFDRWYNSVQLYLRLHKVPQNAGGLGNYWILYTERRAQDAAFQAAELFGEDITRDLLITYLKERFQSSKFKDDTYQKFHSIRQQWNGQVQKISIIATDLLMPRSRLPEDTISDYAFIQQFFTSMHPRHVERPLTISELCYALAVELGSTYLNPENICPQDIVLRSCLGLVAVDSGASTVRLMHYTLQEYLRLPDVLPAAHQTLAQACLGYLNYNHIKGLPADKFPSLQNLPFLEYSSLNWGIHAREGLSDVVKSLALELLTNYDIHISATLLFNRVQAHDNHFVAITLFTGLHCASYFGIVEVIKALIETEGCDINPQDYTGFTPLMWAIHQGNERVLRLLLSRRDINPDKPNNNDQTPLWWASSRGDEEAVRLLLARDDVNPNQPNNDGITPLWQASSGGHEGSVRLLLARDDVDPSKAENCNQTPLAEASAMGHEGVVRLLLARGDVNPDEPDNNG